MKKELQDSNWNHLVPEFRARLENVLERTSARTDWPWFLAEGYRSPERQMFLFGQGRPALGAGPPWYGRKGSIVTKLKTPRYHGAGVAADCYPKQKILGFWRNIPDFTQPHHFYEIYREEWQREGFANPAWAFGDFGHVQAADPGMIRRGRSFVNSNFQSFQPPAPVPEEVPLLLFLDGENLRDVGCFLLPRERRVQIALRALATHLDWAISRFWNDAGIDHAEILWDDGNDLTPPQETMASLVVRVVNELAYVRWLDLSHVFPAWTAELDVPKSLFKIVTK